MGTVGGLHGGAGLGVGMRGHADQRKEAPSGDDMATLYGLGRLSGQDVAPYRTSRVFDSILSR
jgi:hypothetical protein